MQYCISEDRRIRLGHQDKNRDSRVPASAYYNHKEEEELRISEPDMILYHRSWLKLLQSLTSSVNVYVRHCVDNGQSLQPHGYDRLVSLHGVGRPSGAYPKPFERLAPSLLLPQEGSGSMGYTVRWFNRLSDLWLDMLPAACKAEIVKLIDGIADYAIAEEEFQMRCVGNGVDSSSVLHLESIWKNFVRDKVMKQGVTEMNRNGSEKREHSDMCPFHFEFLFIDRDLGCYEHTLAYLKLLETIFERHVPLDLDNRVPEVIYSCILLLPPAEGEYALFNSACDRWKISSAVLRVIETAMLTLFENMRSGPEDLRKHPACGLFEQVLMWVVLPEGQAQTGLRSRIMDLLALGLQIAEESEDETELPHLANALEIALRVVHFSVFVCNTVKEYREGCMLETIIAQRGRVRPGGKRFRSLLESIMCYVTLDDEPKLAWRAMQLMQLICKHRDQDVFQVLVSDTSEATREHMIMAFAEWLKHAENQHEVTTSIFDLLLNSLASVEDEHSVAHYLLGFTPYQPATSELGKICPATRLIQVVFDMEQCWIADSQQLYEIKIRMDDEGATIESGLDPRQLMLLRMAQSEHCLEIFYRLVAHEGTREATLRLLLDPHAYVGWGPRERSTGSVGKLLDMADCLPIDMARQQGADVNQLRHEVKCLWAGADFSEMEKKYWQGGKRELVADVAAEHWRQDEDDAISDRQEPIDEILDCIQKCMERRFDIVDLEDHIDAAQECLLNFFQQSGWYLRTVAILLHSTCGQLTGATPHQSAGDGRHVNFSLDHAQHLFATLFGSPETAGGGGASSSKKNMMGGLGDDSEGTSIWSRGKFQKLFLLAMDLSEVEMCETGMIHEILNGEDFEECKSAVDRWSDGVLWMVD